MVGPVSLVLSAGPSTSLKSHSNTVAHFHLLDRKGQKKSLPSWSLFSDCVNTEKHIKFDPQGIPQWLPPSRCQSFLPWQCGHLLYWSWLGFGTSSALQGKHKFDSCHKHALSYALEKPFIWSFVSADVAVMENTFQVRRGKERRCCARVTLCLFPLSPRGAKARRATFTKRGRGCAWCWNRWEESSVPPRYAIPPSSLSLSLFHSCIPDSSVASPCPSFSFIWLSQHIFFSSTLTGRVLVLFLRFPQLLPPFVPRPTSLAPFSCMRSSWHCAQIHINTLLPITHTTVQKADERELQNINLCHEMSSRWVREELIYWNFKI